MSEPYDELCRAYSYGFYTFENFMLQMEKLKESIGWVRCYICQKWLKKDSNAPYEGVMGYIKGRGAYCERCHEKGE